MSPYTSYKKNNKVKIFIHAIQRAIFKELNKHVLRLNILFDYQQIGRKPFNFTNENQDKYLKYISHLHKKEDINRTVEEVRHRAHY
ncbi:MAG: hypothetical protein K0S26_2637 [Bacteroidota bacterium]|nr:hypothetical protein [Bacteroidota bacterium]